MPFFSVNGYLQCLFFLGVVLILVKPLGSYTAKVYWDQYVFRETFLGPLEDLSHRLAKIDPPKERTWQQYAPAVSISSVFRFCLLFLILSARTHPPRDKRYPGTLSIWISG